MAEVITRISNLIDYENFWSALPVSDDGDIHVASFIVAGDYTPVSKAAETPVVEIRIQAAPNVAYNKTNPTAPHVAFIGLAGASAFHCASGSAKFSVRGIRFEMDFSTTNRCIETNRFVTKHTVIDSCRMIRGSMGFEELNSPNDILDVINTEISDMAYTAIRFNRSASSSVGCTIHDCNTENIGIWGGIYGDATATVINTVCFNNKKGDWKGVSGAYSSNASGDTSASGTGAVTGVTASDFVNTLTGEYLAADGGLLKGTGTGGNDIGISVGVTSALVITAPASNAHHGRNKATNDQVVLITGTYDSPITPTSIVCTYDGGVEQLVDASPAGGTFSGSITIPSGNGDLVVSFSNNAGLTDTSVNVSVGINCFVFPSQSNMVGVATNTQEFTGASGYFKKYTLSNNQWEIGSDPFLTATPGGSFFPKLADLMVAKFGVPIGFVNASVGTTTVGNWVVGGSLNNTLINYYNNAGAGEFEFGLMWIGESDAAEGTSEVNFKQKYGDLLTQFSTLTGANCLTIGMGVVATNADDIRAWTEEVSLTNSSATGYVDLTPAYSTLHYGTDTETNDVAQLIYDAVRVNYYSSIINITAVGLPNGTYSTQLWDDSQDPMVRVSVENIVFTGGTASSEINIGVGTAVYTRIDTLTPLVTGVTCIGVTE